MELYFKDLEANDQADDVAMHAASDEAADVREDNAEEVAFAELSERVSAARLVY